MPNNELIPSYIEVDYNTLQTRLQTLMEASDTFKDYNFEGANISMMIELFSYLGDLSTYYTNLLAKNGYEDTADLYEVVHRLVKAKGYQPKGYVSGQTTLSISMSGQNPNDQIYIQPWQTIDSGLTTETDENPIVYSFAPKTDEEPVATVDENGNATIAVDLREGSVVELEYNGEDIIDNQLILPLFNYDYGAYPYDIENIQVNIKNPDNLDYVAWDRVFDFYEDVSGLNDDDNVFQFNYDKYRRYVVEFSSARNVPNQNASITIKLLKSNGTEGIIDKNILTTKTSLTVTNNTQSTTIAVDDITAFTNTDVAQNASDPEVTDDMKNNARGTVQSQLRNITKQDYKTNLESKTDISVGNAWGEQEINPGQPLLFNKVYFSVIPPLKSGDTAFQDGTLETSAVNWDLVNVSTPVSGDIYKPTQYNSTYETNIITYLEPRKSINAYEEMTIPELVYFMFELGIRTKRNYVFTDVKTDLLNKLIYYFNFNFRSFGETINFMDVYNFLLDPSETSPTDDFTNIRGINNLVFRDMNVYSTVAPSGGDIYDYGSTDYPQFDRDSGTFYDNTIRNITLRYDQFPILSSTHCIIINEG